MRCPAGSASCACSSAITARTRRHTPATMAPPACHRIHPAVGQRGSHHREVVDGHVEGALPGIDVGGLVGVEVEPLVARQEMGDALVAHVGGRLRLVDILA